MDDTGTDTDTSVRDNTGGMPPVIKWILVVGGGLGLLTLAVICGFALLVSRKVDEYQKTAARASTMSQMRSIEAAINAYRLENRTIPPDLDALVGQDGLLVADEVPADAWGNPFHYAPGDDGTSYELISFGEDGVEGGEGDAADITREDLRAR